MVESGLFGNEEVVESRAEGYKEAERGTFRSRKLLDFPPSSAGGISSTARDLLRYEQALFKGRLLSPAGLTELLKPRTEEVQGAGRAALGWWIDSFNDARRIYHTGGTPGFSSSIDIFPDTDTTIVMLSNNWRGGTGLSGLRSKLNEAVTGGYFEIADRFSYTLQKGIDLFFGGDYRGALDRLQSVVEGNLASARIASYYAARARLQLGVDLPAALADLDRFIERSTQPALRKDVARAWYWKGQVDETMGNRTEAVKAYGKALELDPENGPAREALNLGSDEGSAH